MMNEYFDNTIDICDELHQNFIDFAYEANSQRAFADARDGLKPGQRACLWEMYTKGYTSNKPHVKSAKISGGTIATYWPHGDVAVYETFARMSQPWINNIPEVSWHGANGNVIIGPAPANQRYTEARLSKATEEGMLQNIKKNVVPMIPNFSEDAEWPAVLPAIFPRLIVNGCQGIGVTIANVWIPHNLKEITEVIKHYIDTGVIDTKNIFPDFPSGGIIINKNEVHTIYETGKGKVILRGKAEVKGNSILITELPYQVYVEPFIDSVKELIKKDDIKDIRDIFNKSDKKRLLIEIECDNNPIKVLNQLYKLTDLQKSYNANQYALVGKTPKMLNMEEYIKIYIEHNMSCIKNEYQFDLTKAQKRKEIVNGLIKAFDIDIDKIINTIKKSDSASHAVQNLIQMYEFTEPQAKAIVDMKLGKLAKLEKIELNKENENLAEIINECENVIKNSTKQLNLLIERLTTFTNKFGTERKTELINIDFKPEDKVIENVIPEDIIVKVTKDGNIKREPASNLKKQRRGGKGVKSNNKALLDVISTNTTDTFMFFTKKGKMYRTIADNIPDNGRETSINSIINLEDDDQVIAVTSLKRKEDVPAYIIFITRNGMVKKSYLSEYTKTNRNNGIIALNVKEGDEVVKVIFQDEEELILLTKQGMSIHFETSTIAPIGRATMGVKGIKLKDNDYIVSALPVHKQTDYVALIYSNGVGKRVEINDFPLQLRGGKGVQSCPLGGEVSLVGAEMVSDEDNLLISGDQSSIYISAQELPQLARTSIGNILIKNNNVLAVAKI